VAKNEFLKARQEKIKKTEALGCRVEKNSAPWSIFIAARLIVCQLVCECSVFFITLAPNISLNLAIAFTFYFRICIRHIHGIYFGISGKV